MEKVLEGVRVAVLVADGFEQIEVTWPLRVLRRAGADVRVVSLRPGRLRGMNFVWRGLKLPVDETVSAARAEDYGALLLPGGFVNPDLLRQSERALELVRELDRLGRPIAVICHGPEVLVSAGLVSGRLLTSWPGIADDLRNAGAIWVDEPVVRDGRWISSRGPQDLRAFSRAMVELFAAESPRELRPVPRRVRWVSQLSRAGTLGAALLLGLGGRGAWRALRGRRERTVTGTIAGAARAVGVAAAAAGAAVALTPPRRARSSRPRATSAAV